MLVSELYDIQIKNWEKRTGLKWEGNNVEEVNLEKINGLFKQPQMQKPFDVGIKGFKRLLEENKNLSKSQKNAAVRAYKARITERLREVATEYQKTLGESTDSVDTLSKKGLDKDKEV